MTRLISFLVLVAAAAGCFDPCDPDKPNLPVGGAVNSNYIHRCEFTAATLWANAAGGTKFHAANEWFWTLCVTCQDPKAACRNACTQLAENFGVADTAAACASASWSHEVESPYGSSCEYLELCQAADFPPPEPVTPPETPDLGTPTFFCVADLSILPDPDDCPVASGGVWGRDDMGCHAVGPTSACGFPVYDIPLGDDPDQQCQDLCPELFLHPLSDATDNNCDLFVRAEICQSGIEPGAGSDFTWQTATTTTRSPLACTGACCAEFGTLACANLAASTVIAPAATHRTAVTLPVQFEIRGVVSRGTVVGTATYSVTRCPSGQTCPLYLESLELHAASPLTGTWVDAGGRRHMFQVSNLALQTSRPVLGGHRPASGELQLRPGSLELAIRATVDARSMGLPITTLTMAAGNPEVVTGRVTAGRFTIATSIDLQEGARLVIGAP